MLNENLFSVIGCQYSVLGYLFSLFYFLVSVLVFFAFGHWTLKFV